MSRIISIANQKGGVGKTTTSINLSASIAAAEFKTLLIDIDPQGNSSSGIGIKADKSIYEVIAGSEEASACIQTTHIPYLDILPANINLVGAEIELVSMEKREFILKEAVGSVAKEYDYVFIDCPPSLGLLTLNSLVASDSVVIPVQCEYFALEGLGQLLNTINIVKKHFNEDLIIDGVVLTMYDSRLRIANQVVEEVKKYFGDKVFDTLINRNVRIAEAPSHSTPVLMYDAISTGAKNYISLAAELIRRTQQLEQSENE